MPTPAKGKLRILVVEDEPLVAILVEQMLADLDCECVGPIPDLPTALQAAETGTFDGAVLNLVLGGVEAYPVAETLATRGIPFAFASGYPAIGFDGKWRDRPFLGKPYGVEELRKWLASLVS